MRRPEPGNRVGFESANVLLDFSRPGQWRTVRGSWISFLQWRIEKLLTAIKDHAGARSALLRNEIRDAIEPLILADLECLRTENPGVP